MTAVAIELGICAIAMGVISIAFGARRVGWRLLAAGITLIVAARGLSASHVGGVTPQVINIIIWLALAGGGLLLLGRRWGAWLMAPAAAIWLGPIVFPLLARIPVWAWVIAAPVVLAFIPILALRGGQAVIAGLFGNDAAAYVVGHWIIALLGSSGRSRRRPVREPELPRPNAIPIHRHDFGGGQ